MKITFLKYSSKNNKFPIVLLVCSMLTILMTPFTTPWLSLIPFAFQVYRMFVYDEHVFMVDMVFLLPFATIFTFPNVGGVIGVLIILGDIWYIFKARVIKNNISLHITMLLIVYLFLRMGGRINDFCFIAGSLMFIQIMIGKCNKLDAERIIKMFVSGVLISSIYGFVFRDSVNIENYISTNSIASVDYKDLFRFRGICLDSNYYSVFLVLSIIFTVLLYILGKIKWRFLIISLCMLSFFGIQTYSRTFFLMLILSLVFSLFLLIKNKKYFTASMLAGVFVIAIIYTLNGKVDLFNVVLDRLFKYKDLSHMTSGRTKLWALYGSTILGNFKTLFIGENLNGGLLGLGPHNIYLELLYFVGGIGFFLYMIYIKTMIKEIKHHREHIYKIGERILTYIPLVAFLVLYFTLQGMYFSNTYLQLFVVMAAFLLPDN